MKLLLLICLWCVGNCLECLNSKGKSVDWYFVYKPPRLIHHPDPQFHTGEAFFYLDSVTAKWSLSSTSINDSNTPLANTLMQVYANKSSQMYLMYNDQPPGSQHSKNGHTKGVLAFDQTSGVWFIHSTPHYPPRKSEGYQWVSSASVYGQNFMCITFPLKRLDVIGHQLLYYQAHVYDWYFPQDFITKYPVLNLIIKGGPPHGPPWFNITSVTSLRGQNFVSFAKSDEFGADMYDSLIAPRLQQNLLVETWMNGPGDRLPSNCSTTYKVYNIDEISFGNGVVFNETIDHSKWTIASMNKTRLRFKSRKISGSYWVCSSDINRKSTQFKRGGGAVCLIHKKLWTSFYTIITHYQACGKTKRGRKV